MIDYLTEALTWLFFAVNAGRILAYLPQIIAALKCRNGAVSVSRMTWGYFALAHFTTILYALIVVHDSKMALVFMGNFIACCALVGIVTWKKRNYLCQNPLQHSTSPVAASPQRTEPWIGTFPLSAHPSPSLPSSVIQLTPRASFNVLQPDRDELRRSRSASA